MDFSLRMSIDVHFLRWILRLIAVESELRLQFLSVAFSVIAVKFCFFTLVIGDVGPILTYATRERARERDEKADSPLATRMDFDGKYRKLVINDVDLTRFSEGC